MKITMQRTEVTTLYCYLREAERSVHFVTNPAASWTAFLKYYSATKTGDLGQFLTKLKAQIPASLWTAGSVMAQPPALGLFRYLLGGLGRWRRRWKFAAAEIAWIVAQLDAFLQLLRSPDKPDAGQLVGMRQALCDAERIVELRCLGLPSLPKAQAIAHFGQLATQPSKAIAEILRDVA